MSCRLLLVAPALLLAACTQQPMSVATQAPTVAAAGSFEAAAPIEPAPVEPVHIEPAESDAEALLVSSAMSYLGKTAAEFDGQTMVLVEYDRDELLEEAFANPGFCALVAAADADPHDGVLTTVEAEHLEGAVLASL